VRLDALGVRVALVFAQADVQVEAAVGLAREATLRRRLDLAQPLAGRRQADQGRLREVVLGVDRLRVRGGAVDLLARAVVGEVLEVEPDVDESVRARQRTARAAQAELDVEVGASDEDPP